MRSKDQIVDQLNKLPKAQGETNQASHLINKILIEILVDLRDQVSALTTILGSVEKITYRPG